MSNETICCTLTTNLSSYFFENIRGKIAKALRQQALPATVRIVNGMNTDVFYRLIYEQIVDNMGEVMDETLEEAKYGLAR